MQDPIYSEITNKPRPSLFAASGFVLLAAVGLWLSALLELALPEGATVLTANTVYYLPFIALPLALYARRRPEVSGSLRLNPPRLLATLALALLAVVSVYIASILAAAWGYALDALGLRAPASAALPQTERELALAIVTMAALPAVCEELLFRGFALAAWESRGTAFAIGMTAALFALLHGNLYGLPAYLLVGAVAGFVTFALDSVYAGIVYHTMYNAACLVIPWLVGGGDGPEPAMTVSMIASLALELVTLLCMAALLLAALWLRARNADIAPVPRIRRPLTGRERAMLCSAVGVMLTSMVVVTALAMG